MFMPVVSASASGDWRRCGRRRWTGRNDRFTVRQRDGPRQDDRVAGLEPAGDLDGRRVAESDVHHLHPGSSVNRGENELLAATLLWCRGGHDDRVLGMRGLDHDIRSGCATRAPRARVRSFLPHRHGACATGRRGWPRIGHRPRDRRGPRWDYLCRKRAGRRSPVHRHPTARPATRPGVGRRSQQVTPTQSVRPGQCVRTQQTPPAGCASRAGSPCDCWVRSPSRSS
jgi:hypothetical protein